MSDGNRLKQSRTNNANTFDDRFGGGGIVVGGCRCDSVVVGKNNDELIENDRLFDDDDDDDDDNERLENLQNKSKCFDLNMICEKKFNFTKMKFYSRKKKYCVFSNVNKTKKKQ